MISEKKPFFSVVIPVYNKRPHIMRAVDSVLNQTYDNFELLIIDDGSTDGSCEELTAVEDRRVRIIVKKNGGAASARNCGIEEAKGEYIALLDADDEWEVQYLEYIVKMIKKFPDAGLYATAYRNKYADKSEKPVIFSTNKHEMFLMNNYFEKISEVGASINNSSCSVIPISIFNEVGLFPTDMKHFEDHVVWYKIALNHEIAYFSNDLVIIHKDAINRSSSNASALIKKDSIERLFNEFHESIFSDRVLGNKQNALIKLLNKRVSPVLKQMVKENKLYEARKFVLKNKIGLLDQIIYASILNIFTYYVYSILKKLRLKK